MIRAIAQTDGDYRNVYLDSINQTLYKNRDVTAQVQEINSLISEKKTRSLGLRFLIEYLSQFQDNVIQEKANFWITMIIRACNLKEIRIYGELIFEALALLIAKIQVTEDVSKWFATTYLSKFYESLNLIRDKANKSCTIFALKAIEQCLKYYPGPSKSEKPLVSKFLVTLVDNSDEEVVYQSGICWLLLQQVRVNNANNNNYSNNKSGDQSYEVLWESYCNDLLGNLHSLLTEAFPEYQNVYSAPVVSNKSEYFEMEMEGDPIARAAQFSIRFSNLGDYLMVALHHPFPYDKLINPRKILNLIQRGLGITHANFISNPNIDNICFAYLLPRIHVKLLEVLEVLIDICQSELRMCFRLILDILLESVKNTRSSASDGSSIQFINLRKKAYQVTNLWLSTLGEGSGYDSVVVHLIKTILEDIKIDQKKMSLAPASTSSKKSKKNCVAILESSVQKSEAINKQKSAVCRQAYQSLREVLNSVGYLLKSNLLKEIFNTVQEIALQTYDERIRMRNPYNDWKCRLEILKTLFSFITLRNLQVAPPTEAILLILSEASHKDICFQIRSSCKQMIASFENFIHPQKESFAFEREVVETVPTLISVEPHQIEICEKSRAATPVSEDITDLPSDTNEDTIQPLKVEGSQSHDSVRDFVPIGVLRNKKTPTASVASVEYIKNLAPKETLLSAPVSRKGASKRRKRDSEQSNENSPAASKITKSIVIIEAQSTADEKTELAVDLKSNSTEDTSKLDDEQYLAELEAAFVDELK